MKNISDAKIGDEVRVPKRNNGHDGREAGNLGKITHIGTEQDETINGTKYVWMTVEVQGRPAGVWASHCLGYTFEKRKQL
jgi:hypothetical protein